MNKTKWIIFSLIVVAFFGGLIWLSKNNEQNNSFNGDATKIIQEGKITDHTSGSAEQKVVLIEYGDFQCPGCGSMYEPIKLLTEKYKDKLTFVFRNLPLTNIHPNALAAATAAEAAGLQGKFWEMHSLLYQNQNSWTSAPLAQRESIFADYAKQLGLNAEQFKNDLSDKRIAEKLARDRSTAKKFGAESTPAFVLNGKLIQGQDAVSAQVIAEKIDAAISAAYPPEKNEPAQ